MTRDEMADVAFDELARMSEEMNETITGALYANTAVNVMAKLPRDMREQWCAHLLEAFEDARAGEPADGCDAGAVTIAICLASCGLLDAPTALPLGARGTA